MAKLRGEYRDFPVRALSPPRVASPCQHLPAEGTFVMTRELALCHLVVPQAVYVSFIRAYVLEVRANP